MTKYAILASYTEDAVAHMLQHPADRATVVNKLVEASGGKMESFHWMLGPYDVLVVVDVPDAQTIAGVALAVLSTHALKKFESYELIPHEQIASIEEKAREYRKLYQPPGEER